MTVSNTTRNVTYTGNGSTRDFAFAFYTPSDGELKVYLLDIATNTQSLLATNQYVLELNDENEGGTVTYPKLDAVDPTPIASTKKLIIQREVPPTQELNFRAQSSFNPTVLETAFDKLTLMVQELTEEVSRTFRLPPGSEIESIADLYDNLGDAVANAQAAATDAEATYTAFQADVAEIETRLTAAMPIGGTIDYMGPRAPNGWLFCYGQELSRTTYSALFAALCPNIGSATISIASPGVVTLVGHELSVGDRLRFETTGALPTGLAVNTDYYVKTVVDANSFRVSATFGGSEVNTSGSQSGTHSVRLFPHGAAGSTTFTNVDARGVAKVGRDNMGGTSANRLTGLTGGLNGDVLGLRGGAESHVLLLAELAAHNHAASGSASTTVTINDPGHAHVYYDMPAGTSISTDFSGTFSVGSNSRTDAIATATAGTGIWATAATTVTVSTTNTGSDQAHNNVQPSIVANTIIYTGVFA